MIPARSKRLRLVLLLAALGAAGAGAWVSLAAQRPKRFAVVEEGALYRSAQPDLWQIDRLIETVGLKSIVIARSGHSDRVPDEVEHARNRGLAVLHLEIESQKPIESDVARRFFEWMDDPAHRPALVHCSAGRHRTGYLCARYRIDRQGWTVEQAVDEMLSFGFDQTDHQAVLEQIRTYQPPSARKIMPVKTGR
jgi:protein tyrosine/serine phosphatase